MQTLTISDLLERSKGYKSRHAYQKIRNHAKQVMAKSDVPKACSFCGSLNGVQVAHLKGIASFAVSTLVSTVNDPQNLRYLCPNHHWEQERGLIKP